MKNEKILEMLNNGEIEKVPLFFLKNIIKLLTKL